MSNLLGWMALILNTSTPFYWHWEQRSDRDPLSLLSCWLRSGAIFRSDLSRHGMNYNSLMNVCSGRSASYYFWTEHVHKQNHQTRSDAKGSTRHLKKGKVKNSSFPSCFLTRALNSSPLSPRQSNFMFQNKYRSMPLARKEESRRLPSGSSVRIHGRSRISRPGPGSHRLTKLWVWKESCNNLF